ncbi:MAG: tetratricopeptide repeat protein [Bacteroidetes bacterium]|nr:tetratricopeptide repeat protein [Bacteroidota bacterium]
MRFLVLFATFVLLPLLTSAQDSKLAQQYYQDGEFEKAATLYEKLYLQNNKNDFYFDRYIECQLASKKFDEVETTLKKELKETPDNIRLYVIYGNLYERQFQDDKAKEQYEKAIKKLPADQYQITRLAGAFSNLSKYDEAIKTYETGSQLLKDKEIFSFNLAELYRRKGDVPKMMENYLNSIMSYPERLNTVKSQLQRYVTSPEDYAELQAQLYDRIQKDPNAYHFTELLQWVFVQTKDYKNALRQAKALDKRLNENGARIYQLAVTAYNDKDYDAAIASYDYIVNDLGYTSPFYVDSKRESLRSRRLKLVEGYSYTETELREVEKAYENFLNESGRNKTTATIVAELADMEAFYLNDLDKAISLLSEMIAYPGIDARTQALGKLSLGDFYLMKDEIWESILLYSQVDKDFVEDQLGHEARFRNAKLSYYNGDFQWAQSQFDVLKSSTSKLIANDALDLSVFIMDNLGLDTTDTALRLYAEADLLTFQNRFEEAFAKLDSLITAFPKHSLDDDVLYARAKIYSKQRKYTDAIALYQQIVEKYPDEIRADNALFEMAELYETQLNDTAKAMELYEKIFLDYSGSTFSIEARKRFRRLRGDNLN